MPTYRRMLLDRELEEARRYMKGVVLDIGGGRRRGSFTAPEAATWLVLDSNRDFRPHILGDAQSIPVRSNCIDCIKCTELLEHVEYPEEVIAEISRVLKPGGTLLLSTPFIFAIHSDPFDFQRFTDQKLARMLEDSFKIIALKKQGLYFTVLAYMIKQAIIKSESRLKYIFRWLLPVLDLVVKLDNSKGVQKSKFMSSFTTGFFVIAVKRSG
jgi:SAM-dependent methyltransferase